MPRRCPPRSELFVETLSQENQLVARRVTPARRKATAARGSQKSLKARSYAILRE
jgi:hypothetical protein